MKKIKNKIHLITYADSLGGDLKSLHFVLNKHFKEEIKGVHILPFYPSSADRGFTPITYDIVDPKFGTWDDIKNLSQEYELACDLMVNHISSQSKQFQDYLEKGDKSEYADWFITAAKFSRRLNENLRKKLKGKGLSLLEKIMTRFRRIDIIFHKYGVNKFALKRIYRPRAGSPFVKFKFKDGSKKTLWCTFSSNQIDLDIKNPGVKKMFKKAIERFSKNEISLMRLDAVGYTGKRRGTSNFLITESYDFIKEISKTAHKNKIAILPEIRFHHKVQLSLAKQDGVDFVYDFGLPALVLHSLFSESNAKFKKWIKIRPQNAITVLDTHDGIGIVDIKGILTEKQIDKLILKLYEYGANPLKRSLGQKAYENEIYQMNTTFYEALGKNADAYIAARTLQFFVPGIPQVYYVGLLAGKNDYEQYQKTNHGRDVNRHNYTINEIEESIKRDVVQRLLKLIRFRNTHPAFEGEFRMQKSPKNIIKITWEKDGFYCNVKVNLSTKKTKIKYIDPKTKKREVYRP